MEGKTNDDESADGLEPLIIGGKNVHPHLLESRPVQYCDYRQCGAACCSGGVYIDVAESEFILQHAEAIKPYLRAEAQNPCEWFDGVYDEDPDYPSGRGHGTQVIEHPHHAEGGACIFLRDDLGCGLQAASTGQGYHPWHFKPYYCALHPLTIWGSWLMMEEDSEMVLTGGSCQVSGPVAPLYEIFADEIRMHLGEDGYAALVRLAGGINKAIR